MKLPLLSIVIANYNYGRFLEEAIRSILHQSDGTDVELIICDGGSSDNSIEIIKRYSDRIFWWCSESDKGQSEAFNKGFAHARGKYLTWLNADDIIPNGALAKIVQALKAYPDCEWFTGNFYRFTQDNRVIEIGWGPHWYPKCLQRPNSPLVIFGPTTFFSKKIYEQVGRIDESLHYIMDNDLWIRFMQAGIKQRRINAFCWGFRMHEDSKTAEFGAHSVGNVVAEKMRKEGEVVSAKTHYKESQFLRQLGLFLRIFDGSLIRRGWYMKMGVPK